MTSFAELVASRRQWIETVLHPWCKVASRKELLLAEMEWQDIAGRPAPEMTLWLWAWSRFPALCDDGLTTLNETYPVQVTCSSGEVVTGYPDARQSVAGRLVLVGSQRETFGPFSIDEIVQVERVPI